jgi:signal peptidase I
MMTLTTESSCRRPATCPEAPRYAIVSDSALHEPEATPQVAAAAAAPSTTRRTSFFDFRSWLRDLAFSLFIAAVFIVFLYQPVKVEGTSMMPLLYDQERIFINKFVYKFEDIQRGDIVVFWYPLDPSKSYVKRVIGLPGETVKITGGRVFVNGLPITEPYVRTDYLDRGSFPATRVEPEHFFVMGDHRNSSSDSRTWGTVARRYIYGKAVLVYWPVNRFGRVQ